MIDNVLIMILVLQTRKRVILTINMYLPNTNGQRVVQSKGKITRLYYLNHSTITLHSYITTLVTLLHYTTVQVYNTTPLHYYTTDTDTASPSQHHTTTLQLRNTLQPHPFILVKSVSLNSLSSPCSTGLNFGLVAML